MIGRERASQLVQQFPGHRILVLGDLILDRYVWGNTERISQEAPVPVVRVESESTMLGGAGNVARNLASLGAQVEVLGLVGDDATASELEDLFDAWKIDARTLLREQGRPTTQKTRVISRGQQVVRFDRESEEPIGVTLVEPLLDALRGCARRVRGAIIQNYGKGLLPPGIVREAMAVFADAGVRVFVDPKDPPWDIYRGAELIKPNLAEAEHVARMRVREERDFEPLGAALLEECPGATVAVTRAEGITLFGGETGMLPVPTRVRAVSDVAGAGDTTIAALSLARLSSASWQEAAELANVAAGVVVQVRGTATLTADELLDACGASP